MADERIQLGNLGEDYIHMLRLEAFIKASSLSRQAESLLCTHLYKQTQFRNDVLERLAWKRQISVEELKSQVLASTAPRLSQDELIDTQQVSELH